MYSKAPSFATPALCDGATTSRGKFTSSVAWVDDMVAPVGSGDNAGFGIVLFRWRRCKLRNHDDTLVHRIVVCLVEVLMDKGLCRYG